MNRFNVETAVGHKKAVQDIGVHAERQKGVGILVLMSHFWILPGAPRGCADFCDPTAVSRSNIPSHWQVNSSCLGSTAPIRGC